MTTEPTIEIQERTASGEQTVLEAHLNHRYAGEIAYIVVDVLVGRHLYLTDILVSASLRHRGVGRQLLEAVLAREPGLPVYTAPHSHNSADGNMFIEQWNRRGDRQIRWHAEP